MEITTKKEYLDLIETLLLHDHLYYSESKPKISDYEYDQLFLKLREAEKKHPDWIAPFSPTQRVSDAPLEGFEKRKHRIPMLSLQNTYDPDEVLDFDKRIKKLLLDESDVEYHCEPKFDGLAIELIYENGHLTSAITRGDGRVGENVISNVKTISTLPLKLKAKNPPELLEVRGEILIHKEDFLKLNKENEENNLTTFANPRNAAAGSIRQLNSKIAASRPLKFYGYAPGDVVGLNFKTQSEFLGLISDFGIPTAKSFSIYKVCKNIDAVLIYYSDMEATKKSLPFEIDGIVIKVNNIRQQEELGFIARNPRWAAAAKFKPDQELTTINNIEIQIGRTGVATPVAILEPVNVGGVTISNATLHNFSEIKNKDIRIGDSVFIHRAGEVIPEVIRVDFDKRKPDSKPYSPPDSCPSCKTKLVQEEGEVALRCPNINCPAASVERLKHFVSRKALNIDKLGDKIIDRFFELGLIKSYSDIYKLNKDEILGLDRFGDKSVENLFSAIEESKKAPLENFIFGLGIRFVGEKTSESLAQKYQTLENFLNAKQEELEALNDIGPKVTQSILTELNNASFINEIKSFLKMGINPKSSLTQTANADSILSGKKLVITGSFEISRTDITKALKSHGVQVVSSVSKNTDYLLAGDAAGSKMKKAQELGIEILSWADLKKLKIF